jgi:sterol desaturase/sphingolipid hydroxylase (fatty acid hydroxylase superfamily)
LPPRLCADGHFRPQLEAKLGSALPSWPIAKGWAAFVAAFLLFDLLRCLVHRCKHAVPFLWRFHTLHHSDPDVDVTTTVRLHPIEYHLNSSVFWLTVILFGIPGTAVLTYGLTSFAIEAVQHGNIRLPQRLDRWLQSALVTVDMHRIQHSVAFAQGSCNYATVFSIWDRLFRTYTRLTRAHTTAASLASRNCRGAIASSLPRCTSPPGRFLVLQL